VVTAIKKDFTDALAETKRKKKANERLYRGHKKPIMLWKRRGIKTIYSIRILVTAIQC
jgi:hypothetical protein